MLFPPPHDGGVSTVSTGQNSFVGGGHSNSATEVCSTIAGGAFNDAAESFSTVGGGFGNQATGEYSTVGGGVNNNATAQQSTVAGGNSNFATASQATVGGGTGNTASSIQATVGGGSSNFASGGSSTVSGGAVNQALGEASTVAGGSANLAEGFGSTACGGFGNQAIGAYSLAAGRNAHADHFGSFVWADGNSGGSASSADNQFNVYASGGTRIFSDETATSGVLLAPGAGSWSSVSDRKRKENVAPIEAREILARLVALPLSTWNYKTQASSIRHLGPMAQDFHAAFGLGSSDELIDTVDADGVALGAIQGLHEKVVEQELEIQELRSRLQRLTEIVEHLSRPAPAANAGNDLAAGSLAAER
jgi:hypothetical protein